MDSREFAQSNAAGSNASGFAFGSNPQIVGCCTVRNFHPLGWEPSTSSTTTSTTTYYSFVPENDDVFFMSIIHNPTNAYVLGWFEGYIENTITKSSNCIIKLKKDLSVDSSFAITSGLDVSSPFTGFKLIQQTDGKIIVAGLFSGYNGTPVSNLVRINTDGSIDTAFQDNIDGGTNNYVVGIDIDSLGRIIVPGRFSVFNGLAENRFLRLNPDGTKDNTLVQGAGFNNITTGVTVLPDNSMIVTGYFSLYQGVAAPKICKITSTGARDATFVVGTGILPGGNSYSFTVRIGNETSVYLSGSLTSYKGIPVGFITKINSVGNIDNTFQPGTGFNDDTDTMDVIWTNKLLITGEFTSYNGTPANKMIVLNADGSVLFASSTHYFTVFAVGDTLFARTETDGLKAIFTLPIPTTTTSTTPIPTTTTTTTALITTTTSTTGAPTTTTSTTLGALFQHELAFGDANPLVACGPSIYPILAFTTEEVLHIGSLIIVTGGPFNGGNLWYQAAGGGGVIWQITPDGFISNSFICP